jgi:heme/copper-type cytochrome/quinol oxidase subunit 2
MIFKNALRVSIFFGILVAVVFLGWYGVSQSNKVAAAQRLSGKYDKATNTRTIKVLADQYFFKPSTIRVREGENLRFIFTVRASEIETIEIHGFSVPKLNKRWDLPVGDEPVIIDFGPAPKAGKYFFECDIFCGPEHPDMNGTLIVLPKE